MLHERVLREPVGAALVIGVGEPCFARLGAWSAEAFLEAAAMEREAFGRGHMIEVWLAVW